MEFERYYKASGIIWPAFPDIIEEVLASIPEDEKMEGHLVLEPRTKIFLMWEKSIAIVPCGRQAVNYIQNEKAQLHKVDAAIDCTISGRREEVSVLPPSYFEIHYDSNGSLTVKLARSNESVASRLFHMIEERLVA